MGGKSVDCTGKEGLDDQETKHSEPLAVKCCGDCNGGRNFQSHERVHWKVGLAESE